MKICNKCGELKATFHKNKNRLDGLSTNCTDCVTIYSQTRYNLNKETEQARAKIWRQKNSEYLKIYEKGKNNRKRYWPHLSNNQALEQFNLMLVEQDYKCKICKKHQSEFKKGLVVDHCHSTKKVRGLLCQNCNAMIGMAKEEPVVLFDAIHYVMSNKENV